MKKDFFLNLVSCLLLFFIFLNLIFIFVLKRNYGNVRLNLYFELVAFVLLIIIDNYKIIKQKNLNFDLQETNKRLECCYDNVRSFKHDFSNIMQSIGGYIAVKDIEGLKKMYSSIVGECQAQLNKVIDPEDYYDTLQDGVEDALIRSRQTADTFITPKLLVWDLLTIAYSDESYDEAERKLLKYIVRKTNIDKAVFLEMESSILTLMDIEKELAWIKTTNKPYLTIEAMVNELADRKSVIFESVKDLIAL